ncbi:MAG: deoxyribose-phosphate aldolase [Firmicutes bacterium]|nr:deoxyribose-phosphate aldolase [Bacillota bacterium]
MHINHENLALAIDHTLLKPEATRAHITEVCAQAKQYNFKTVCINPFYVQHAYRKLSGSTTGVCTVIGFPFGATLSSIKAAEAAQAIRNGASEIDFVINIGALKDGDHKTVEADMFAVVKTVKEIDPKTVTKVILETCLLSRYEKIEACKLALNASVDFVKTSTGFSAAGAKVEDIKLLKEITGSDVGVKASGGIKDLVTALKMLEAGADRLGTSSGVEIIREAMRNDR